MSLSFPNIIEIGPVQLEADGGENKYLTSLHVFLHGLPPLTHTPRSTVHTHGCHIPVLHTSHQHLYETLVLFWCRALEVAKDSI